MNRKQLDRLLERSTWWFPTLLLIAVFSVAASFYWLQLLPLANQTMQQAQSAARGQVEAKVQALVGQVERVLLTTRDWGQAGLLDGDAAAFNRLMTPILRQRSLLSSVHFATDGGQETMLIQLEQGWKNRLTDLPRKGRLQRWLEWNETGDLAREEMRDQDYDPRSRPWFKGAQDSAPGEVHWTAPYIFKTTQDPGITLSARWQLPGGGDRIVALDIMLADLSRFTTGIAYGTRGYVALLTGDNKLLGLPKMPRFSRPEAVKAAVLKTPEAVGLPLLAAALGHGGSPDATDTRFFKLRDEAGETWLASVRPLTVRNLTLRVVTLVPASDFSPLGRHLLVVLAAVILPLVLLVGFLARLLARRLGASVGQVFDELELSRQHLQDQFAAKALQAELVTEMQKPESLEASTRLLLSRLAGRFGMRQGVLAMPSVSGELAVVARYGLPEGVTTSDQGLTLLSQCARERQSIHLVLPKNPAWRIRSGLGEGTPAEVRVMPVVHGDTLVAVLELALLHPLDARDQALLEALLPEVALALSNRTPQA